MPPPKPQWAEFGTLFEPVDTVVLEEPDSAPITGVRSLAPHPNGGFVITDRGRPQARIHAPDGSLVRIVGRFGDGPGEFRRADAALVDPMGRLYVGDTEDMTITRFHANLTYDTAFHVPGRYIYNMFWMRDGILVTVMTSPSNPQPFHNAIIDTAYGSLQAHFSPVDTVVWCVPYWQSFFVPLGAGSDTLAVTGNSFAYPLRLYDGAGELLRTFGTPPPSYRPPGTPERGEFTGLGGFDRLERWLRAMTVTNKLGIYRDSLIMVVHAAPDPSPTGMYENNHTTMDIYDLEGVKLWHEVEVPGRVYRVGEYLYILETVPPDGPWTVVTYRWRNQA